MLPTYSNPSRLKSALNRYARALKNGDVQVSYKINELTELYPVEGRCLELALPDVPLTKVQKEILDDFMKNSKDNFGIDVIITIITN